MNMVLLMVLNICFIMLLNLYVYETLEAKYRRGTAAAAPRLVLLRAALVPPRFALRTAGRAS